MSYGNPSIRTVHLLDFTYTDTQDNAQQSSTVFPVATMGHDLENLESLRKCVESSNIDNVVYSRLSSDVVVQEVIDFGSAFLIAQKRQAGQESWITLNNLNHDLDFENWISDDDRILLHTNGIPEIDADGQVLLTNEIIVNGNTYKPIPDFNQEQLALFANSGQPVPYIYPIKSPGACGRLGACVPPIMINYLMAKIQGLVIDI